MATPILTPVGSAPSYQPGRTLGRTGHVPDDADRVLMLAEQLDALLCVVSDANCADGEPTSFQCLNDDIQLATLKLASGLAKEVHELLVKQSFDRIGRATQPRDQSANR